MDSLLARAKAALARHRERDGDTALTALTAQPKTLPLSAPSPHAYVCEREERDELGEMRDKRDKREKADDLHDRHDRTPGVAGEEGAPQPPEPAAGAPGVAATVAQLLGMTLGEFARVGRPISVRVPWWPEPLVFVPDDAAAKALVARGTNRGIVWTAKELADLLSIPGITQEHAATIALAKIEFAGDIVDIRQSGHCEACDCRECVP
jgi:hypothetical protein